MAMATILRGLLRLLLRAAIYLALASTAALLFLAIDAGLRRAPPSPLPAPQAWPAHAAAPGAVRAAPLPPLPQPPPPQPLIVQQSDAFDIAALGARVRPLPGGAREGWLVVNVVSGAGPLQTGDVIAGACDAGRPISADLPVGVCLRVIRGQAELEVKG